MRHRAVFPRLSPPRLRRWRWVLPEDAGNGVTPQRAANEASDRSRSGLSPATTRRAPATLRADAAHSQHRCGVRADEWRHDTVDGRDLGGECPVAVGEQTQGPASHRARVVEVSHAEARRVGEQLMTREPVELIVQVVRCPTTTALIWLMVWVRAWIAERRATRRIRSCSTQSFGLDPIRRTTQKCGTSCRGAASCYSAGVRRGTRGPVRGLGLVSDPSVKCGCCST
jgi:hypothetical protein